MELLSLLYLIFTPLLAGFIISFPNFPNNHVLIRRFAKSFAGLHLIYSMLFLINFNPTSYTPSFQTELTFFKQSWLQTLGIKASFGVDGISLIFVILTSLITFLALFASRNTVAYSHKLYYSLFFVAQTSILGTLCSQDMFIFFFFLELGLIPIYFLISHWIKNENQEPSKKFLCFNILGGFFILTPMLILYFYNFAITDTLSASIETLNFDAFSYPEWFKLSIFTSFIIGFFIRGGLFPFHNWIIDCAKNAQIPVVMFLLTAFSMTGIYGILRFNMSAFPETFSILSQNIFVIALIGIIYLIFLFTTQKNTKIIFSYWSIIQNLIVVSALTLINSLAYNGAILFFIANAITTCGLLSISQITKRREKTYLLPLSHNLADKMPRFKFLAYIIFFATILTPFFFTFEGANLIILSLGINSLETSLTTKILLGGAIFMLIIANIYTISIFHQILFSNSSKEATKIKDLTLSEMSLLSFITITLIFFGLTPMNLITLTNSITHFIVNIFRI